ncbi:hypothetical protein VYU27_008903 [Nannochloropsis oceanica]
MLVRHLAALTIQSVVRGGLVRRRSAAAAEAARRQKAKEKVASSSKANNKKEIGNRLCNVPIRRACYSTNRSSSSSGSVSTCNTNSSTCNGEEHDAWHVSAARTSPSLHAPSTKPASPIIITFPDSFPPPAHRPATAKPLGNKAPIASRPRTHFGNRGSSRGSSRKISSSSSSSSSSAAAAAVSWPWLSARPTVSRTTSHASPIRSSSSSSYSSHAQIQAPPQRFSARSVTSRRERLWRRLLQESAMEEKGETGKL